eukprot:CAMPEP_0168573048 /NCGR_PEP_ID=MMETSP0413-20121227/18304_1 /TAXON_ID=136452 /ORGANISM="Filamoeba nolandi, Strain NC-AS-23-1" /LENGTH=65 /DNA_ID=CAMNT_0008606227 /DNA_START=1 /DNA_END=198 /DNA_ORIENTATION=-
MEEESFEAGLELIELVLWVDELMTFSDWGLVGVPSVGPCAVFFGGNGGAVCFCVVGSLVALAEVD